jgi:hypothetical protein
MATEDLNNDCSVNDWTMNSTEGCLMKKFSVYLLGKFTNNWQQTAASICVSTTESVALVIM